MVRVFTAMSLGLFLSLSAASQQEAAAPAAMAAVQSLLDDSVRLAKEKKGEEALLAAERAVSVAGEAKDIAGEALAQRERALRLAELKRPTEAREAWRQAGIAWKRIGDGTGQVEALAMQALLLMAERAADARALLNQAIALARAEKARPQAAARKLNELGKSLADLRKPDDALEVYKAALVLQEEIPVESLDIATSLNGLGGLVLGKGDLTTAAQLATRAWTIIREQASVAIARARRVVLSPDGVLWELPFAALVINDTGAARYLGLEKPLSYAQSLAVFAQAGGAGAGRAGGKGTVLVVGNPLFDNARRAELPAAEKERAGPPVTSAKDARRTQGELALLSRDGSIPEPLPGAEEEARRVAALYGVKAWVGAEPTEKWFRDRAGEAEVIHLATHGYFNPYRALSSGLRLAVPEQQAGPAETDNDGALQAWEILNEIHLKADLVVLSACETGLGAKVKGEGLVGLTRAFQVAGAQSVLASQWRVADQSTADLMVAFHERLRAGEPKDEALRRAMAKVAKDPATADPFFWAAFLLVGDYRGK